MSGAQSHHYYNAMAPSLLSFVLITVVCQIAACGLGHVPPPPDLPEICHNYTPSTVVFWCCHGNPCHHDEAGGLV